MVGTPIRTVHPSASIRSSASSAVNPPIRTSLAPARNVVPMPQIWPKVWDSGRQPSSTSAGRIAKGESIVVVTFITRLRWVSAAPLGRPVVPEV
ncbi:hypothetical protein SFUMM280S_08526 [Streptomyces fumanus]